VHRARNRVVIQERIGRSAEEREPERRTIGCRERRAMLADGILVSTL